MPQRLGTTSLAFLTAVFLAAGCEVSVGDGNFDGGFPWDDEDASSPNSGGTANTGGSTTGGTMTGGTMTGGTTATGGTSTGGTVTTATPLADFPAALAEALCDAQSACVGEVRLRDIFGGNACDTIVAAELTDGPMSQVQAAISAGLLAYDSDAVTDCLSDVRALSCEVLEKRLPASCEQALQGSVSTGNACYTSFDCAGAAFCDFGEGTPSCPGVCKAQGRAGATCLANEACVDGLFCTPSGTCQAPRVLDDPCDNETQRCALQYSCAGLTSSTLGRCKSVDAVYSASVGDDCTPNTGTLCEEGLVCARDSRTCVAASTADGACVPGSRPDACPADQYCGASSVCVDRGTAGATCTGSTDKECAAEHVCIGGTCQKVGAVGETCTDDLGCYSYHCNLVSGECEPEIVCF